MKLKYQIILHTIFWVLFMGLPVTRDLMFDRHQPGLGYMILIFGLTNVVNFYTCFFFINQYVLRNTKGLRFLWWLLPFVIIFTLLRYYSGQWVISYFPDPEDKEYGWYLYIIQDFINTLVYTVISLLITFFVGWLQTQKQKDELIQQKQEAEIALLRSQINPHFLFNTLNNLYSLVYRKSDDAPGALMKLSDILRYMLYESNTGKVALDKELTYITSYIELQQLRLQKPNFIRVNLQGDPHGKLIAPMVLITFIENAFKHGSKQVESPGIMINIDCRDTKFEFEITSYLNDGQQTHKDPQKGIGLQNVKRRLELIYPGRHTLAVNVREQTFQVKLSLTEL